MKRKWISVWLWIALFVFQIIGGCVWAADAEHVVVNEPRTSGDVITITGNVPAAGAGKTVAIQIIRPSGTFGVLDDVFYMFEVASGADGNFEHAVYMNDNDASGWYTVYAGAAGYLTSELVQKPDSEEYVQAYYYVSKNDRMEMVKQINAQTSMQGVQTILDSQENRRQLQSIGMLMGEYDAFPEEDKAQVAAELVGKDFASDTMLGTAFNDKVLTQILQSYGSNIEQALEALRPYSYLTALPYERYDEITQEVQRSFFVQTIFAYNQGDWTCLKELQEAFLDGFALLAINEEHNYENIWTVLEDNMERLKLDQSALDEMENITDSRARQFILQAMTNQNFLTVASVREAFLLAVDEGKQLQDKPSVSPIGPSGGGGSGGGSGGSRGGSSPAILVPKAEDTAENETESEEFSDVPQDHWAYVYVMDLYEKGIVSGNGNASFEPDSILTREVFVKMLVAGLKIPHTDQSTAFTDVAADEWYASYIADATAYGIVQGVAADRFGVGEIITRQDMAVMLARAAEKAGIPLEENVEISYFADHEDIADYAKSSVYLLKNAGMIDGVDEQHYDPNGNATKAQAAKVIYFLLQTDEAN